MGSKSVARSMIFFYARVQMMVGLRLLGAAFLFSFLTVCMGWISCHLPGLGSVDTYIMLHSVIYFCCRRVFHLVWLGAVVVRRSYITKVLAGHVDIRYGGQDLSIYSIVLAAGGLLSTIASFLKPTKLDCHVRPVLIEFQHGR
jgi:hypothetical protein